MKQYEILEHKADLKIKAFGKEKSELFLNMLLGMTSGLHPKIKKQKGPYGEQAAKFKKIKVKSPDLETLLVDFLSEVLYLTQVNKEVYKEAELKKFTDTEIESELIGQEVERFGEDIKAVTYHGLDIHQKVDGTWEATVLFDI